MTIQKETNALKLSKMEVNAIKESDLYVGEMKAYFSTYNTVNYRPDRMVKGCFDKEIQRFRNGDKMPRFLAQHWGSDVIGVVTNIYDDEIGAICEVRFINTPKGNEAYVQAKTGAIDELSFAFYVTGFDYVEEPDGTNVRNVTEVSGIEEISMVTWGMDPKTRPIEVNSKDLTIRHAETALKNAGFSNKDAKTILSSGFKSLNRDDSGTCDASEDIETIMALNNLNFMLKERIKNV